MYKDILLAVDLNDESSCRKPVETAVELAKMSGGTLHIMTVVPDFGMSVVSGYFPDGYEKEAIKAMANQLHTFTADRIPDDVAVQHIVGHGSIYEEIMRLSREIDCDLIVMGAYRQSAADYLLGPNAARVVRHAEKSVLVVRG